MARTVLGNRTASVGEADLPLRLASIGAGLLRYGLALVILWIGLLKFTTYEAMAIMPLVAHSPFMSWMLGAFGLETTAHIIGAFEILTAVLIALRAVSPRLATAGGGMAVFSFLATISFLFTTPAMALEAMGESFPFLSMVGQFLLKDFVLLGASVYLMGEAWFAAKQQSATARV